LINKREIYRHILGYYSPEEIDVPNLAKQLGISVHSLGAHIRQAKHNSNIATMMVKEGYDPNRFGPWVKKPKGESKGNQATKLETRLEHTKPKQTILSQVKKGKPTRSKSNQRLHEEVSSATSPLLHVTATSLNGGSTLSPPDNRTHRDKQTQDQEYRNPQEKEQRVDKLGDQLSDITMRYIDLHVEKIVRKVALNPSIYQLYNYAKNKVDFKTGERWLPEKMDIGDFVSWCVRVAMKAGFGVEPGIFVHPVLA
jgi:hypothetical protein